MMKPIVMILLLLGCTFSVYAAGSVTQDFKNLQAIRAKKIAEINSAYVKALEKLKIKSMQSGDLVTANAINEVLKEMKAGHSLSSEMELSKRQNPTNQTTDNAKIYCKSKFGRFRDGSHIYTKGGSVFSDVPDEYDGRYISLNESATKEPFTFEVKKAGKVLVVVRGKQVGFLKAQGWRESGEANIQSGSTKFKLSILEKTLEQGAYTIENQDTFGTRILRK